MKVTTSTGDTLYIKFTTEFKKKGNHTTHCLIEMPVDVNFNQAFNQSFTGEAKCNHRDVYNKLLGKRIALDRALKKIWPSKESRLARAEVWGMFLKIHAPKQNKEKEQVKP